MGKRSIASFSQVAKVNASIDDNKNDDEKDNPSDSSIPNDDESKSNDTIPNNNADDKDSDNTSLNLIDSIIEPEKPKPVYKGVYLDPDVAAVLEKVVVQSGRRGSKSVQSKIVNEALRKLFKESGLLK